MTFRGDDLTIPATPDTSQARQHGFLAAIRGAVIQALPAAR
jgi:hypothetical protein